MLDLSKNINLFNGDDEDSKSIFAKAVINKSKYW